MRMWNVDPKKLCRQHLLGEHVEMHMFVGSLRKGKSIAGFLRLGLVEPAKIRSRHDVLARELTRRGMHHRSPILAHPRVAERGRVDREANLVELARRCVECRKRQKEG